MTTMQTFPFDTVPCFVPTWDEIKGKAHLYKTARRRSDGKYLSLLGLSRYADGLELVEPVFMVRDEIGLAITLGKSGHATIPRTLSDTKAKKLHATDSATKCYQEPTPFNTHFNTGYLHESTDDSPYDVDGVRYCGRCHHAI